MAKIASVMLLHNLPLMLVLGVRERFLEGLSRVTTSTSRGTFRVAVFIRAEIRTAPGFPSKRHHTKFDCSQSLKSNE